MNEEMIKQLQDSVIDLKAEYDSKLKEKDTDVSELRTALAERTERLEAIIADDADRKERIEQLEAKLAAPGVLSGNPEKAAADAVEAKRMEDIGLYMKRGEEALREKGTDLQVSTDSQGGYAVPEELRQQIIMLEHESSPMRQVSDVRSSSTTDVKQLVSVGQAASGWVGETTARPNTGSPELAQRIAAFGEVYANPLAYQHSLEDPFFDAASWLAGEVAREFTEQSNLAFLSGDGTNKPVGLLNNVAGVEADRAVNDVTALMQVIASPVDNVLGSATDVDVISFLKTVILSLKTGYLSNSRWMMNRATYSFLTDLKDGNSQFYLNPNIANAAEQRLLGYPILINEDMDDIDEAASSFPVVFGDIGRAYQIIDRVGVSTLRDPYSQKGAVQFYTRKRVGSMLKDVSAVKVIQVGHT